jgi:hypothetical protein
LAKAGILARVAALGERHAARPRAHLVRMRHRSGARAQRERPGQRPRRRRRRRRLRGASSAYHVNLLLPGKAAAGRVRSAQPPPTGEAVRVSRGGPKHPHLVEM